MSTATSETSSRVNARRGMAGGGDGSARDPPAKCGRAGCAVGGRGLLPVPDRLSGVRVSCKDVRLLPAVPRAGRVVLERIAPRVHERLLPALDERLAAVRRLD